MSISASRVDWKEQQQKGKDKKEISCFHGQREPVFWFETHSAQIFWSIKYHHVLLPYFSKFDLIEKQGTGVDDQEN